MEWLSLLAAPDVASAMLQAVSGSPITPLVLCVILLLGGGYALVARVQRQRRD